MSDRKPSRRGFFGMVAAVLAAPFVARLPKVEAPAKPLHRWQTDVRFVPTYPDPAERPFRGPPQRTTWFRVLEDVGPEQILVKLDEPEALRKGDVLWDPWMNQVLEVRSLTAKGGYTIIDRRASWLPIPKGLWLRRLT